MTEHKKDELADVNIDEPEALDDAVIEETTPGMSLGTHRNRFASWFGTHKKIWIPIVAVLLAVIVFLAVTDAKYTVVNLFTDTTSSVAVVDASTSQPIAGVTVALGSQTAATDQKGMANFKHVPYGPLALKITKFAYTPQSSTQLVELLSGQKNISIKLFPTGTPVPFLVTDAINGKPIKGAKLSFSSSNTITASSGETNLNVPPQSTDTIKVLVEAAGYILKNVDVSVNETAKNEVRLMPAGKLYFLSNRNGKIDVMKSNLDGTEAAVVLAGTGQEDQNDTVLLASRDWKYLALKSRREGDKPQLYLINTSTDALSVIDHGNATFNPTGWYNDQFIFTATRSDVQYWQQKQVALKTYSASTAKLTTIDENNATGEQYAYARQIIGNLYILDNRLIYTKTWDNYNVAPDQPGEIISVRPDGTGKQVLKAIDATSYTYIVARAYAPEEVYFEVYGSTNRFYEFEDGAIKSASISQNDFDKSYPTFIVSPSGKSVFWQETRDGKNTIFVGNSEGKQEKQVAALAGYKAYGWYSDEYLLISKGSSELFIMPVGGVTDEKALIKITNYYKPQTAFDGYGYGYGAF